MKKLFKSTVALFLGLCILCTSVNTYELLNPSAYDQEIKKDDSNY